MTRRKREARRKAAELRNRAKKQQRKLDDSFGWTEAALAALATLRDFTEHLADDILRDGWYHADATVRAKAEVLRKVARYCGTPEQTSRFKAVIGTIQTRAPKIAGASFWGPCYTLAGLEWLRPLAGWKPTGKSEETIFRSLVDHLLVRYPVPKFLYGALQLDRATDGHAWTLAGLFESFACGESAFEYIIVNIPAVMTRRMCHLFMQSPPGMGVYHAIRQAQISALGGTPAIAGALCRTRLGKGFELREETWFEVMRWMCGEPDLVPATIGPLVDYVAERLRRDGAFSMKGRTVASLTRQVEAWHAELAKYGNVDDTVFTKSGFKKGTWEFAKVTRMGAYYDRAVWTITEVLTARDLAEEGHRMSHCVYSYRRLIEEGKISIWSLAKDAERMLTVELDHQAKAIIEALGKHNRPATSAELNVLKHWAQENSLALRVK